MSRLLLALALVAVTACTTHPSPALSSATPECQWAASRDHGGSLEIIQLKQQCGLTP